MENFQSLGLPEPLFNALTAMDYTVPTKVQAQTIPHALLGKDVVGTAQTGTGKTAAYGIPLISYLLNSEDTTALVLTPTRELATQVLSLLTQMLGNKSKIRTALIIGGDSMGKQLNQLAGKPRIIVGTPGRLNDHLDRGTLKLDKTGFLVLDETDRMLDMGFGIQLDEIAKFLPKQRQTLMFSATFPSSINTISTKYLKDAVRVSIGSTIAAADTIKQETIRLTQSEKYGVLMEQLDSREGTVIVFVKTKMGTEELADKLRDDGHSVAAIHGDLRQRNREKVIRGFRNKKHRILVATDVAARGLDIPHIECVINHDLPQCEEDFIHRIGRTGRAGSEGIAISLITPQDHGKWRDIHKMMNPGVKLDSSFDDPRGASRSRNARGVRNSGGGFRRSESRSFGGRPEGRSFDRRRPEGERSSAGSYSSRPDFGSRDERPRGRRFEGENSSRRSFGGQSEGRRSEGNSRPSFGGRSQERRFEGNSRPSFGDRSEGRRSEGNNSRSSFGGRSQERRFEGNSRPSFGARPERRRSEEENSSRRSFGERSEGRRSEGNSRPSFGNRPDGRRSENGNSSRPSFGDRSERRESRPPSRPGVNASRKPFSRDRRFGAN